jgi:hypothetical protein
MRGISWLAAKPVSFSRRTLLHGVSKYTWRCCSKLTILHSFFLIVSDLSFTHSVIYCRTWLQLKNHCKKIWWLIKLTDSDVHTMCVYRHINIQKCKMGRMNCICRRTVTKTNSPHTATGYKNHNKGWIFMGRWSY